MCMHHIHVGSPKDCCVFQCRAQFSCGNSSSVISCLWEGGYLMAIYGIGGIDGSVGI